MLNPLIMSFPDFSRSFSVTSDASDVSIAAVLQQEKDNNVVIIDSIGRALKPSEKTIQ